ncbi:MAG: hypothetical protein ACJ8AI_14850 [Rhodopila sp.]
MRGYSTGLMAVEPLWRWLREGITYHHCHGTAYDLIHRVATFRAKINVDPDAIAYCLWSKEPA